MKRGTPLNKLFNSEVLIDPQKKLRADALTEELLESQGQLGDLNMLVEKLHTDTELDELERQISTSKSKNARDNQILNDVFMQRQSRDNAVKDTEKQIEEERKKAEKLLSDLVRSRWVQAFVRLVRASNQLRSLWSVVRNTWLYKTRTQRTLRISRRDKMRLMKYRVE